MIPNGSRNSLGNKEFGFESRWHFLDLCRCYNMKNWTSVRAVYLLMSIVLLIGVVLNNWWVVMFVISMLQIGVWTKFCPSKWLFEKLGLEKSKL